MCSAHNAHLATVHFLFLFIIYQLEGNSLQVVLYCITCAPCELVFTKACIPGHGCYHHVTSNLQHTLFLNNARVVAAQVL